MLQRFVLATGLILSTAVAVAGSLDRGNPAKVSCTAIREEPGAPTYGFELIRKNAKNYEARYLSYPGDETLPPEVVASIPDLQCRFLSAKTFYFQCSRLGASVESIEIEERKLSLIENQIQKDLFREFRATGSEVPGIYLVYRFGKADTCTWN